jgi:hypothetical protein
MPRKIRTYEEKIKEIFNFLTDFQAQGGKVNKTMIRQFCKDWFERGEKEKGVSELVNLLGLS